MSENGRDDGQQEKNYPAPGRVVGHILAVSQRDNQKCQGGNRINRQDIAEVVDAGAELPPDEKVGSGAEGADKGQDITDDVLFTEMQVAARDHGHPDDCNDHADNGSNRNFIFQDRRLHGQDKNRLGGDENG